MTCGNQGGGAYDNDPVAQCEVLRDAYPAPFTVQQLKKVRSLSRDPEMLRSYLLELTKRRIDEESKAQIAMKETYTARRKRFPNGEPLFNAQYLYEKWVKPSPSGRALFIRRMQDGQSSTLSVEGPDSTVMLRKSIRPDLPNKEGRDELVSSIKSGRANFQEEGAVGFTEVRFETSTGMGFSVRLTPRGAVLPLIKDGFK